jgi:hypothetical protein
MHMTDVSGATGRVLYERRQKESHRETVTYEIEMLHFCFDNLPQDRSCDRSNEYLLLEGFLLHYRNLLEFFSGTHHRAGYDISMADSSTWGNRELGAAEIAAIITPAKVLDHKYHQTISTYLQHCTLLRHEQTMAWDAAEMRKDIDPIITEFVRAFPS